MIILVKDKDYDHFLPAFEKELQTPLAQVLAINLLIKDIMFIVHNYFVET